MERLRSFLPYLIGLLVVAALVYGLWPSPLRVQTAEVDRGPLRVTLEEEGRTRVENQYTVHAPGSGYLNRIDLEVGDSVRADQPVARLSTMPSSFMDRRTRAEAEARVESARSALEAARQEAEAAKTEAAMAERELDRTERLHESGAATERDLEQARTQAQLARARSEAAAARVGRAENELEAARSALRIVHHEPEREGSDSYAIRSPASGTVLALHRKDAGVVQAGQPLLTVGDPNDLEVVVEVLSSDAVQITPGTPVDLQQWGGPEPLEARVRRVEPKAFTEVSALGVEEQRVQVIADLLHTDQWAGRIGDGYRVDARFILWETEDAVRVPRSALFREDDRWAVFLLEDGRAALRNVEIGRQSGLYGQVLSGLEAGDRVIVHPGDEVEDGARVEEFPG